MAIAKNIKSSIAFICMTIFTGLISATVFAQQTYQSRAVRPMSLTGDLLDILNANDERVNTRAYSGKRDYVGMGFTLDVGSEQNIIGVSQEHGNWPTHYPGAYKVEVAALSSGPWMLAWEGEGQRGESKVKFPAIRARFIRVTATAVNTTYKQEWSIAEVRAGIDPGQTPRIIPSRPAPVPDPIPPATVKEMKDVRLAWDSRLDTYAASSTPDYAGLSIVYDLGGEYELSRVVQVHGNRAEDYPGEYKIEVSRERNESRFREVWRGAGESSRSIARFNPIVTRYVRITALRNRDRTHVWSIAELRTNRDRDVVERDDTEDRLAHQIRQVTARGLTNINAVIDEASTTRATTGTPNYAGSWVQADLGGSYTVSRVVQVHNPDEEDYPGRYRIETSLDGARWQTVFEGRGERGRSSVSFTPVRARFIRITATANHDNNHWWSLYKLRVLN